MTLKFILPIFLVCVFLTAGIAQTGKEKPPKISTGKEPVVNFLKSSPAFAEISLRRAELRADLESLLLTYTDENPKVKEIRFELEVLNRELNRLLTIKPEESGKLTPALGKMIVRKAELETDLWNLRKNYTADHPEVKRAVKKVEIFENAIKEILN